MSGWQPKNPEWERSIRESFARQGIMATLGAELTRVEPGFVEIACDFREGLAQQHGFFHAGVTSTLMDSAGGYAAFSLFPPDSSILTVEFKINLLAPAAGSRLFARGRVFKPGRTLTICDVEGFVLGAQGERICAKMQQTLMCLEGRADMPTAG
jgi:uncharacterized protein (TIGR00369 family)